MSKMSLSSAAVLLTGIAAAAALVALPPSPRRRPQLAKGSVNATQPTGRFNLVYVSPPPEYPVVHQAHGATMPKAVFVKEFFPIWRVWRDGTSGLDIACNSWGVISYESRGGGGAAGTSWVPVVSERHQEACVTLARRR